MVDESTIEKRYIIEKIGKNDEYEIIATLPANTIFLYWYEC